MKRLTKSATGYSTTASGSTCTFSLITTKSSKFARTKATERAGKNQESFGASSSLKWMEAMIKSGDTD